jgi:DtxR family Mn-dependent transcriptional regulator
LLLIAAFVLWRRWRKRRRTVLWEDAVKRIYSAQHDRRPTTSAEVGGQLGLTQVGTLELVQALETAGLVNSRAGMLELTETGEQLGRDLLRGHRLWERYLSGDAQLPLTQVHADAERAEHRLAASDIEALADHLGHPRTDPHGDVVPAPAGAPAVQPRTPLTDWPMERLAVVVHVEDEPKRVLEQALAAGLRPGTVFRVVERDADSVVCETAIGRTSVIPAVAAGIDVRAAVDGEALEEARVTLAELPLGRKAEIFALADRCTGLARRRLLDLGFTEGAQVRAALSNLGDEARVYEIRGTKIALRQEQAAEVLIIPADAQPQDTPS